MKIHSKPADASTKAQVTFLSNIILPAREKKIIVFFYGFEVYSDRILRKLLNFKDISVSKQTSVSSQNLEIPANHDDLMEKSSKVRSRSPSFSDHFVSLLFGKREERFKLQ